MKLVKSLDYSENCWSLPVSGKLVNLYKQNRSVIILVIIDLYITNVRQIIVSLLSQTTVDG